ncbi:sensor histidine kinase [Dyadobacter subterraneus]|uniref:histidine kinase n=1 Tax=Dyadobacter subterraneus TaxID=2773304 RepID=A0ABR9W7R4_9BACT|nr:HAMP domain-containing sensor histidine kinase [Dyadobacter subterraneus]MBE9460279.1 HAMP domain-containing histidine kinase [Dyadobacter subterraneus]
MKLLEKTSRIYLMVSLVIYLAVGIAFYWIIKYMIYDEVETRLKVEMQDFESFIRSHDTWNNNSYFVENKIEVMPVTGEYSHTVIFKDTLIQNRYDEGISPFRQLTFYTIIGGVPHRVAIRKSMIESYKLIEAISAAMVTFLGLLMISMFLFQRRLSGKLWKPFYDTLTRIKEFDLTKKEKLQLPQSEVTEFSELDDVLKKMADKMQHDYTSLKEFTENASHEIQTPLALINARVEQFIQSKDLSENHTYWIEEIYHASRRMSRLNQGLLLLAKIENQQFTDTEDLDLVDLLKSKLSDFEDILTHKQIEVKMDLRSRFDINMSPSLADILLNNILSNAIRHNYLNGQLFLESDENYLKISNTGSELSTDPERLFERFKKESSGAESVGLGLAIVKQICDNYWLEIEYTYHETIHSIIIRQEMKELAG